VVCFLWGTNWAFYVPEDDILHSNRRENFKSYIVLAGWALERGCNVFRVRYDLGFYIPEDGILHSHFLEYLLSYISRVLWHSYLERYPIFFTSSFDATALGEPWPPWQPVSPRLVVRFLNNILFTRLGQPHAQPPTWRARVSLVVWTLPFDISGMTGPTST
jgi:hypothetical protein